MERVASADEALILDYGADLSPYRSLFPNSDYRTADIGGHSPVDYRLTQDGSVPERSETFDLILSTQVAEHLLNPSLYFAESYRLLKPGGRVFLSTHGAFEDHAFPNDYQRWTGEGLRRDLVAAGFERITLIKLTVGPRAVLFLAERCLDSTWLPRRRLSGMLFWLARKVEHMFRPLLHWLADRWFFEYRVVFEDVSYQNLYVGIVAIGHRPNRSGSAC
jgi:SAM-dependent methyltransferase